LIARDVNAPAHLAPQATGLNFNNSVADKKQV